MARNNKLNLWYRYTMSFFFFKLALGSCRPQTEHEAYQQTVHFIHMHCYESRYDQIKIS